MVRRAAADLQGRRVHDQQGARGRVAQLHLHRRQPEGRGAGRAHRRGHARRCPTRSSRRSTSTSCPSTSGASSASPRRPSTTARTASAPARSCSSSARRASSRASAPTRTSGAAGRRSTAWCCATSTTRTRWWPRSSAGEIDAAEDVPGAAFKQLQGRRRVRDGRGLPGRDERARDQRRRRARRSRTPRCSTSACATAIGHAIDRETIIDRVLAGLGKPSETLSVSPNPTWTPAVPPEQQLTFDLDRARSILEDAGYEDTDGDGVREMPGGGQPLNFRYAARSEGDAGAPTAEFITGWLKEIGIDTTVKVYDDGRLTELIGKGDYDMFAWGWTPFVDPDQMLSYFTCDQVSQRSRGPDELLQRRELVRRGVRPALRAAEGRARPGQARGDRARDAPALPRRRPSTTCSTSIPTCRRTRRGSSRASCASRRRPARCCTRTRRRSYARLELASASTGGLGGDDGGGGSGGLIAIIVAAVVVLAVVAFLAMRRRTADERE